MHLSKILQHSAPTDIIAFSQDVERVIAQTMQDALEGGHVKPTLELIIHMSEINKVIKAR